jgi:hypothetical protein
MTLHLATFRVDTEIPLGHPLCGGWIQPAVTITEPLYALGIVLLGNEAPVVLCAVDWTGINNAAHRVWCEALAKAAHTTPERVAVQCVHQHNAPFAVLEAEALIAKHPGLGSSLHVQWFHAVVERVAEAVRKSLAKTQPVTHVGFGQAAVEKVASNRRIIGAAGKLTGWRGSSCKDPKLRQHPDGLIDPLLRSVTLWNSADKLAVLHYYATHPMSYYGDGLVTSDFVGLAREARSKEDGVPHLYFTGCAGNIAAGKYNDGDRANRFLLAGRIYRGMKSAEQASQRLALREFSWRCVSVVLPARTDETAADLRSTLGDATKTHAVRSRAAMKLIYRQRAEARLPLDLTALHLGTQGCLLHLPGESFVEFQCHAQEQRPGRFVATAAYGDGGPWYIPTASAYPEGGYEPGVAFVDPAAEALLRDAIIQLVS